MDGSGRAVHVLATADDPMHAYHRKLVLQTLGKRIRALGPTVGLLAEQLLDAGLHGNRIDYATGMADKLPLALIAELVGLPQEDVPQLLFWAYDSTEMLGGVVAAERFGQLVTSSMELAGYLHTHFMRAKADPKDDFMGVLAAACTTGDLTDDVAVLILIQLVGAGGESTAGLIANAARLLAAHPDIQDRLRRDPSLVDAFLDEALESPFRGHYRHVIADTELGGVTLTAGSHALLMWGSANRDPARFDRPDEIVLDRPSIRSHLAFGKGLHFCVGSALARMEAHAAITLLLQRSTNITFAGEPAWVPSIFVRRHRSLPLSIG